MSLPSERQACYPQWKKHLIYLLTYPRPFLRASQGGLLAWIMSRKKKIHPLLPCSRVDSGMQMSIRL